MNFLTSNDFGRRFSAKSASLTVGYSRTGIRIYKSTAYFREKAIGKTLDSANKYPLTLVSPNQETATVYYNGFQMGPLLSILQFGAIFNICLKGYIFPNSVNVGDRV